jgi:hypothetical protein
MSNSKLRTVTMGLAVALAIGAGSAVYSGAATAPMTASDARSVATLVADAAEYGSVAAMSSSLPGAVSATFTAIDGSPYNDFIRWFLCYWFGFCGRRA